MMGVVPILMVMSGVVTVWVTNRLPQILVDVDEMIEEEVEDERNYKRANAAK